MDDRKAMTGIANKVVIGVVGAVVAFIIINALLPTFLTSISDLNKTVAGNAKVAGGSGIGAMLYLLPFLLVIGVVMILVFYFMKHKGHGWG